MLKGIRVDRLKNLETFQLPHTFRDLNSRQELFQITQAQAAEAVQGLRYAII